MDMEVQVSSNMPQLGTFGDSFTPSWGQRGQEYCFKQCVVKSKTVENTGENERFESFGLGRLSPLCRPY